MTRHPFIQLMHSSFQTPSHLVLTLEFIQGGDLFTLLRQEQTFINDVALFYMSEILLALEHLHKNRIVYRDLKPENLMIASDGHIKLVDFGFSKLLQDK